MRSAGGESDYKKLLHEILVAAAAMSESLYLSSCYVRKTSVVERQT